MPDIIDKPIGRLLFAKTFNTGRVFAHTLLFIFLLFGIGLYRWHRYRTIGWLVLTGSCLLHDLFDSMWAIPETFYWPLFGMRFYAKAEGSWIGSDLTKLMTDPTYYVPEIVGFIITLYCIRGLVVHHRVKSFIRNGVL